MASFRTLSGLTVELANPRPADIHFAEIAEPLAKACRFAGHLQGVHYSVAQHCTLGSEAVLRETGDARLAAYFLLHDAHEYVIGDLTTPIARTLADLTGEIAARAMAGRINPHFAGAASANAFRQALEELKARWDIAIHAAAGLPPPTADQIERVKLYDRRALVSENLQLRNLPPRPGDPAPLAMRGAIRPLAWPAAAAAWIDAARALLPSMAAAEPAAAP